MAIWMGLSGIALAILAAGYVVGMLAERWRLERREFDAKIAGYEQRGGRHARGAAPAAARPEPASVPAGRPPWEIPPRPGAAGLHPPSAWPAVSLWLAACIAFAGLDTARRHASRHGALGRCPPPIPPINGWAP